MTIEFNGTMCLYFTFGIILILAVAAIITHRTSGMLPDSDGPVRKSQVFGLRPTFLRFGFAAALAFVILAFSWTHYESEKWNPDDYLLNDLEEVIVSPPSIYTPPTPPPPVAPPAIEILPEDELAEAVVFETTDIGADDPVSISPKTIESGPAMPVPPALPSVDESDKILIRAQVQPNFPGCESIEDGKERDNCSDKKLLEFIYQNIRYPEAARNIGIEGMVFVRFVVEKDGSISKAEVLRDPGGGLGTEALRVVQMMPLWHPGRQQGRAVRVQFNLPVNFKLQ
jgi:protein TonB